MVQFILMVSQSVCLSVCGRPSVGLAEQRQRPTGLCHKLLGGMSC